MRILCFSDLHISNRNPKYKTTDGVSDLLIRQTEYVEQICEYVRENEIEHIAFLGDWTDYPNLDPITLYYSNKMITMLADTGAQVFLLEGNHCLTFKSNNYSVLDASSMAFNRDNVHFINHPHTHKVDDALTYYFMPYSSDKEELIKQIKEMNLEAKKDLTNVFFFHFPTMNALYDSGIKSSSGIELRQEYISNFDVSLGGDFHKAQKLGGTKSAYYIGAPFCFNYGDGNEDRGFIIYTPGTKKTERVENKSLIKILKMDSKEVAKNLKKDFSNCIIKLTSEITLDEKIKIENSKLAKTCYKIDYSFIKSNAPEKLEAVQAIQNFSKHNDRNYIETLMKTKNTKNPDKIIKLFDEIKLKVENK